MLLYHTNFIITFTSNEGYGTWIFDSKGIKQFISFQKFIEKDISH